MHRDWGSYLVYSIVAIICVLLLTVALPIMMTTMDLQEALSVLRNNGYVVYGAPTGDWTALGDLYTQDVYPQVDSTYHIGASGNEYVDGYFDKAYVGGSEVVRSTTFVVAASDALAVSQAQADYLCDGAADEVEIQAAIDALPANGGVVQLTEGAFTIAAGITLGSGDHLTGVGRGTIVTIANGFDTSINFISQAGAGSNDVKVSQLLLDGNKANQAAGTMHGIFVENSYRWVIENVEIENMYNDGINFKPTSIIDTNHIIIGSKIRNCRGNGIYTFKADNVSIFNSLFDDNNLPINAYDAQISSNSSELLVSNCVITNGNNLGILLATYERQHVIGSTIHNNADEGIRVAADEAAILGNNLIFNDYGVTLNKSGTLSGVVIVGNEILGSGKHGIHTLSTVATIRLTIADNLIRDNSVDTANTYDGIYLNKVNNAIITGNTLLNGSASWHQRYAINIQSNCSDLQISDNIVTPNDSGTILDNRSVKRGLQNNIGYIAPGEMRYASGTLTAGVANDISFAWNNPEDQDILIKKVVVEVTTAGGTVGSHLDVGIADDVTGTNRGTEVFDDLDLNAVQINDSWVVGDGGTQTKWVFCQDQASAIDDWIVGQILDANAASLVGSYYIEYVGR